MQREIDRHAPASDWNAILSEATLACPCCAEPLQIAWREVGEMAASWKMVCPACGYRDFLLFDGDSEPEFSDGTNVLIFLGEPDLEV